jgi:hypothetical protein
LSSNQANRPRNQAARPANQPTSPDPPTLNEPQEVIHESPEPVASPADNEFRRYRSRGLGTEILARKAAKPFCVLDRGVLSDGQAGWWECHYIDSDGGPDQHGGWAMIEAEFYRLYEVVA